MSKAEEKRIIKKLWEKANLQYLLKGNQIKVKDALVKGSKEKDIHSILCSRRFGKSFIMCCWAIEVCLKKPRSTVKYACPEQKMVEEILHQNMPIILDDCPDHLKPEWKEAKKKYVFPNGSQIQIAAVNNGRYDSIRGGAADLCIIDEAAFIDELEIVVYNVMGPTIDTTGGKIVMASTPNPENPVHPYHTNFIQPQIDNKTLIKFTVYDSPMVTKEYIEKNIIPRYVGGRDDPKFRCEYLCEFAVDTTTLVIPEFSMEVEKDCTKMKDRPPFFDFYVSGDPGAKDLTVVLFAYFDYERQTIVIEDELVMGGEGAIPQTRLIADGIKRKEKKLYYPRSPFKRIMDNNNLILINDLWMDHKLRFYPTQKDKKKLQVDKVRRMISQGHIEINPDCKVLLYHLRTTKWKTTKDGIKKDEFARHKPSSTSKHKKHHGDAVDALIYLVRNVMFNKNPFPDDYGELQGEDVHNPTPRKRSTKDDVAAKLANLGSKRRRRR